MMKQTTTHLLLLVILCFFNKLAHAQCLNVGLPYDFGISALFRGVNPNYNSGNDHYLITASELSSRGYVNGTILTGIGGTFYAAPSISTSGTLIVYLENTTDVTNLKSASWATAISTMTSTYNATTTIANSTSWSVDFSSNFTYTGGGLYVGFAWTNCGTASTGTIVACNSSGLPNGLKGTGNSNCAIVGSLTQSNWRPVTVFKHIKTVSSVATACNSYTWAQNSNTTYTVSGNYTHTFTDVSGCDSVHTLNLTVNYSNSGSSSETVCNSYVWNGTTYTVSGAPTHTYTNMAGCDSIHTLNLIVHYSNNGSSSDIGCDSYTWGGSTYTSSGNYTHTFSNMNGCDSVHSLSLTVNHSSLNCGGDISVSNDPNVCGAIVNFTMPTYSLCAPPCSAPTSIPGYTSVGTFNGHKYFLSNTAADWQVAKNAAISLGGHLVTITSGAENTFVNTACFTYPNTLAPVWLGASDSVSEGNYQWVTGEPFTFVNWRSGEPNGGVFENYIYIYPDETWNDASTVIPRKYLVEFECSNSSNVIQTAGLASGSLFPVGTTTNTFQITDANNVTYSCSFNVVVADTQHPVITTQNVTLSTEANACGHSSVLNCTQYKVTDIPFAPVAGSGTPVYLSDDAMTGALPIGFDFNFYCNTYNQFYISSNGFITFDGNSYNGCCSGQYIPDNNNPNNMVAGAWSDLYPPSGGTIEYFTTGTAPNRKLVVNYINIAHFSSGTHTTFQIVLNESSNAAEVFITDLPAEYHYKTQGVENADGTLAVSPSGRNSSNTWTAQNDGKRFEPEIPTPFATDNCSVVLTSDAPALYPIGSTNVVWTAVDASGNSTTATQVVTVIDDIAPVIQCPSDITVNTNDVTGCFYAGSIGTPTYSDNCTVTLSGPVPAGPYPLGATQVTWTATDSSGNVSTCTQNIMVNSSYVVVNAKAILAGPYNSVTGLMHDSLRVRGLIPATEPYSGGVYNLPAIGEPGGETVSTPVLAVTGNNAIVDWVYLELRSAASPSTIVATKRALIQRDGDIVSATDGVSPVAFATMPNDSYYVSLKHRNHLGVMTIAAVNMTSCNSAPLVDFTTLGSVYVKPSIATTPRKLIGGVYALWSGDANTNKNIKYNGLSNDKDMILNAIGGVSNPNNTLQPVYRAEDLNMDGKIRYNNTDMDRGVIIDNVGPTTPNKIINQHTPN